MAFTSAKGGAATGGRGLFPAPEEGDALPAGAGRVRGNDKALVPALADTDAARGRDGAARPSAGTDDVLPVGSMPLGEHRILLFDLVLRGGILVIFPACVTVPVLDVSLGAGGGRLGRNFHKICVIFGVFPAISAAAVRADDRAFACGRPAGAILGLRMTRVTGTDPGVGAVAVSGPRAVVVAKSIPLGGLADLAGLGHAAGASAQSCGRVSISLPDRIRPWQLRQ